MVNAPSELFSLAGKVSIVLGYVNTPRQVTLRLTLKPWDLFGCK